MATLSLAFRERTLKLLQLAGGESFIGRDSECDIVIDSLAVEPRHAIVCVSNDDCSIAPASPRSRIRVNGTILCNRRSLQDSDCIEIGKHVLTFHTAELREQEERPVAQLPVTGWLQIQSGKHLGRTIRLDKAFTRIGKPDEYLAILARRNDGYFISHLLGSAATCVNGQAIDDQGYRLRDADTINVGELQVQFFTDAGDSEPPELSENTPHRQYDRIPLKARAGLCHGNRLLAVELVDISLHGALVHYSQPVDISDEAACRLVIHFDNGVEISMRTHLAHREENYLGLQCDEIDAGSISHLRRLIERNQCDPDLLERDLETLGQANHSSTSA